MEAATLTAAGTLSTHVLSLSATVGGMSGEKSSHWRAFDRVERAVGRPLEDLVASRPYLDVALKGRRVQRAVRGAIGRVATGAATRVLHAAQIPTREEVRNLNRQLTNLTTEMRSLAAQQRHPKTGAPAKPRPTRAPKAKDSGAD